MDKIYEWCPYCCDEVELDNKFEAQICPRCGRPILPCSLCYPCLGWNYRCPLRDKEKKLNAMFGFND